MILISYYTFLELNYLIEEHGDSAQKVIELNLLAVSQN